MLSNHASNDIDLVQSTQYNIQPNRVAETPPPELWPLPDFTILMTMVHQIYPPILIDSIWL